MTIETPLWLQGIGGVPTYPARVDRMLFAQLWDEGVMDLTAFKVSQRAAGANFTVDVSIGEAVVTGDDQINQGNYLVRATATDSGTITAAPGTNSRYDIVCLKINDPNAGGTAGSNATIVVTAGTAAAVPTVPVVPASSLLLAVVGPIATGTSSITNAIIADARQLAGRRALAGTIEQTSLAALPNGWLYAAGQAISRAVYSKLFANIGTTYGVGDGSTTFNVPDYRGRVGVALDNMGGTDAGRLTVANTLGGVGGAQLHTLTIFEVAAHAHVQNAHSHTASSDVQSADHSHTGTTGNDSPDHTHQQSAATHTGDGTHQNGTNGSAPRLWIRDPMTTSYTIGASTRHQHPFTSGGVSANHTHAVTVDPATPTEQNAGSGQAHNNMQPYVLVNVLIRT